MNDIIIELKSSMEKFKNRLEQAEERISNLEDVSLRIIQSEKQKVKKEIKKSLESLRYL